MLRIRAGLGVAIDGVKRVGAQLRAGCCLRRYRSMGRLDVYPLRCVGSAVVAAIKWGGWLFRILRRKEARMDGQARRAPRRVRRVVLLGLVGLLVLAALVYFAFRKVELQELQALVRRADATLVLTAMGVGLLSHLIRARRWQLLLNTLDRPTNLFSAFYAVMLGYFCNLLLPRVGEAVRCAVVSKQSGVKLEKSLGTMVTERLADVFVMLLLTIVTVLLSLSTFGAFLKDEVIFPFFRGVSRGRVLVVGGVIVALVVLVVILLRVALRGRLVGRRARVRMRRFLRGIAQGINSIRRMDRKWEFIGWTVGLWVAYWLMTYIVCLALPATRDLGVWVSLTLLVVGTFGMFVPVQGGIGSFHLIVTLWLMAQGLPRAEGLAYATLSHGCQTALLIVVPAMLEIYRLAVMLRRRASHK